MLKHPVDKLLEQHCNKSAAGVLQSRLNHVSSCNPWNGHVLKGDTKDDDTSIRMVADQLLEDCKDF